MQETVPFSKINSLDKKYKPLILKWLSKVFNYKDYKHSFRDQFINWSVWNGKLSITFDTRSEEQKVLLSLIHPRFIGTPQRDTMKIVNTETFYLDLNVIISINYPDIVEYEIIHKTKQIDNDGDVFFIYEWKLKLSDGKYILYRNQRDSMDLKKHDFIYDSIIQEREFLQFLENVK